MEYPRKSNPRTFVPQILLPVVLIFLNGQVPLQAVDPGQLRALLDARVGGIEKLQVPAEDDLPQPGDDGSTDPRFAITPEKVYLGRLLFFDPVRSSHIRPEYEGVPETSQTVSCGSCHMGEAASKAGKVVSLGVGGEGRHEMDSGGYHRIVRDLMEGVEDLLPTPLEVVDNEEQVVQSGRFDAVDAPGRVAPSVIGFAFNIRLLWGGEAGEENPEGYPAQEDVVRLATMAHRMASPDYSHLQEIATYRQLFAEAFPEEHQAYLESGNLDDLINLDTQVRAIAAFLRTVITRDTAWDRFLAGNDSALTERQLRGAWLFVAPAEEGGANCITCHSGPALNKQLGDEEGLLVEDNFHNLGTLEHPLQELARQTLEDPDHHDLGYAGVTDDPADAYKFKSPTLRQAKDAAPYFHGGQAQTLREVVEYFNAGVAANPLAADAGTLSPLFTHPRSEEEKGLGLSEEDIQALVDFLGNGLYDRAFVHDDPDSPTQTFELGMEDLTYSAELKALGAVDGWLPSGLPPAFNDEMSRGQLIFVRGRTNTGDNLVDSSDAIFILEFVFLGGPAPLPVVAADVNDDGSVDISDPVYLLRFLFLGDSAPPHPFPEPGCDLTR